MFSFYSKLSAFGGGRTRYSSTAKPLASRNQIDCMDSGLSGSAGAREIISMINSRPLVNKLILGHNELADDGCVVLFTFLRSAVGRQYRITEISLNSNGIGDRGLIAIAMYLTDNTCLKELFLQNNQFTCNPNSILSFTRALNTSRLRSLSLTTNTSLSDTFVNIFLAELDSPTLGELHLSALGITRCSAPRIAAFISSPRCRLHTFKCNGNSLGFRGVRSIIRAIKKRNFTLLRVELLSNQIAFTPPNDPGSDNTEDEDDNDVEERRISPDAWKSGETLLKVVLARNAHRKRKVEKQALKLLVYSRSLDLKAELPHSSPSSPSISTHNGFHTELPTELQLNVLRFLALTLSTAQRLRIFTYASSLSTLPALLPSLKRLDVTGATCLPDPSTMNLSTGSASAMDDYL
ncbi:hypothetical protein K435DRAFT_746465 [Dendrothele bispora CBS 962.96]|uniref:RNI-like protein n=1 Tax=Dendrothele bispora (strain CBS 962.96) TaxID=1314807 RepID=A0A4S8MQV9_DENBC|nr:hypothetical protein K435DRAFT_746465 [Dendrothele bispora CBS 962.96]